MLNLLYSTKAWAKTLDDNKSSGIRFIADPAGEFTKAWDVAFDATPILGNYRSKRYAIATEDGKVVKVAVEPDNTGVSSKFAQTPDDCLLELCGLTSINSLRRRKVLVVSFPQVESVL